MMGRVSALVPAGAEEQHHGIRCQVVMTGLPTLAKKKDTTMSQMISLVMAAKAWAGGGGV